MLRHDGTARPAVSASLTHLSCGAEQSGAHLQLSSGAWTRNACPSQLSLQDSSDCTPSQPVDGKQSLFGAARLQLDSSRSADWYMPAGHTAQLWGAVVLSAAPPTATAPGWPCSAPQSAALPSNIMLEPAVLLSQSKPCASLIGQYRFHFCRKLVVVVYVSPVDRVMAQV